MYVGNPGEEKSTNHHVQINEIEMFVCNVNNYRFLLNACLYEYGIYNKTFVICLFRLISEIARFERDFHWQIAVV